MNLFHRCRESFQTAKELSHAKERSASCRSALVFIISSFGQILDSDCCSIDSHKISMLFQPWP